MLVIPQTWATLEEFAQWYRANGFPIRVPANVVVYPTDISYSCCVFRQDVYQVEMYMGAPNSVSTDHSHPFEQLIIFLGGHMSGARGGHRPMVSSGSKINRETDLPHPEHGTILGVLPPNMTHEIVGHEQGFVFFNCQKWPNKEMMSSAVVHYDGPPLGPLHQRIQK